MSILYQGDICSAKKSEQWVQETWNVSSTEYKSKGFNFPWNVRWHESLECSLGWFVHLFIFNYRRKEDKRSFLGLDHVSIGNLWCHHKSPDIPSLTLETSLSFILPLVPLGLSTGTDVWIALEYKTLWSPRDPHAVIEMPATCVSNSTSSPCEGLLWVQLCPSQG